MKKNSIVTALTFLIVFIAAAQSPQPWNGKKCAVVLTYDDAIDQHLDHVAPLLDSLQLKATFYITAFSNSMRTRMNEWKQLAVHGQELGNHTLYHPCIGNRPGREFVREEYNLTNYTVQRMVDETRMTNLFLAALDGKKERTFAFTCGDMKIGDSSFIDALKTDFIAARGVSPQMHPISQIDLYNIDCYVVNGESGAQMIQWAKKAMENHSLLVVLFHGVGGGNSLNVAIKDHREFLEFLKKNEKEIWIAPMIEIAKHIKKYQSLNN